MWNALTPGAKWDYETNTFVISPRYLNIGIVCIDLQLWLKAILFTYQSIIFPVFTSPDRYPNLLAYVEYAFKILLLMQLFSKETICFLFRFVMTAERVKKNWYKLI